jgi:hypothetical protein
MKKHWKFIALTAIVIFASFYFFKNRNPFPEVEWIKDSPGATDRYVTFTPVLKSNNKIIIGPIEGADYAKLHFEDINNDGIKEAIIETDSTGHLELFFYEKHVLEYKKTPDGDFKFRLLESKKLNQ